MAEYQIGSRTYELPDNLPPKQLNEILTQLAAEEQGDQPKDTSFSSAFQSGVDAPLENLAKTAEMLGAEGTAKTLSGLTEAPQNYESASDRFINPEEGDFTIGGFAPEFLPRAVVEQAGQLAGSLATRTGGGLVGGAATGGNPLGIAAGALAGPALFEFAQQLGPVAAKRAANNGRAEPTWEDWQAAAATAGVSGLLNAIGVKGFSGASLLNRTIKEGVTEGAQSVTEQTGSTAGTEAGLNINPKQAIGEGIIGGTTAGSVGVGTDAVGAVGRGVSNLGSSTTTAETDTEAAADFANDLSRVSEQDGYDLKDVDTGSATGARAAIDTLHTEYASQIEQLTKDLTERLKVTADDSQVEALEKVKANAAKRKAKNKVKSRVDPTDITTIENLTAGTQEGKQLLALMRKSNELSALANQSLKGGISQYTDVFNPLDTDGRYNVGRAIAAPVSGLSAITSGGVSLAPALAGRAIDAVTGRRSRVARFVDQNKGNQGIQTPAGLPSIRDSAALSKYQQQQQQLQDEANRKQANRDLGAQGAAPTPNSPQATVEDATGLDKRGVADIITIIERISPNPAIVKAVEEYRISVDTGGVISNDMLSPLIRQINVLLDSNAQLSEKRVREPNRLEETRPEQTDADQRKQKGKEENIKFLKSLRSDVNSSTGILNADKAKLNQALVLLSQNLGVDPVVEAEMIVAETQALLQKPALAEKFLVPYLNRIRKQQQRARK